MSKCIQHFSLHVNKKVLVNIQAHDNLHVHNNRMSTHPFTVLFLMRLNLSGPATVMVFLLEGVILFSGRAHTGDSDIQRCCLFLKIRRPAVHDSVHLGSVLVDPPLVLNP
jgi:hypothetical protein